MDRTRDRLGVVLGHLDEDRLGAGDQAERHQEAVDRLVPGPSEDATVEGRPEDSTGHAGDENGQVVVDAVLDEPERDQSADGDDLAVGEVDESRQAVDEGHAQRDEHVDASDDRAIHGVLQQLGHRPDHLPGCVGALVEVIDIGSPRKAPGE